MRDNKRNHADARHHEHQPQQRWRKILQKVTLFTHGIDIEDLFQHGIEHKAFHLFVHRQLVVFLEQVHISSVINDDFLCLLVVRVRCVWSVVASALRSNLSTSLFS